MASLIYSSHFEDLYKGNVDVDVDAFKAMLVTADYVPNKDTHNRRDDVTNEASGAGYTAGGDVATCSVSIDTANDRVELALGAVEWPDATITAAGAVYYKSRGGSASADELVAYVDFDGEVTATGGTFALGASTLRIQN